MSPNTAPPQRLTASDATALDGATSAPWLAHDVDGRTVEIRDSASYERLMERRARAAKDATVPTAIADPVTSIAALGADGSEVFTGREIYDEPTAEPGTAADGGPDLNDENTFTE